ncbi:cell wall-binding repeat-containing protein [Serinicoccus sp. CNJ-927]|uniref:cell wall-binding repeat-containing protein n=1 Tax=Serinicoccus sp. CNJ-927 TaxID=1904970 RepID=UPI00130180E4|nr:cell wall-binding repeat-containing protein [Serinicoccus sp. CNJ-927]
MAGISLAAGLAPAAASAIDGPAPAGPVSATGDFQDGTYIVVLNDLPLATNPGTAGSALAKTDTTSADAVAYTDRLLAQQDAVLQGVAAEPTYRYTVALNGFSATLTAAEAASLSQRSDVASVTKSSLRQLQEVVNGPDGGMPQPDTEISPDVLGLRGQGGVWSQVGGPLSAGAGTVVGVIDSGIAFDNPAFAGEGIPAPPASWSGECETGEGDDAGDFPASACTNKLVGGRYFVEGARSYGLEVAEEDSVSPLDTDNHGSHVAGTAAGREVSVEDTGGNTYEMAGMVPGAHVAAYKVCYDFSNGTAGCAPEDSIAAIDAAVADGVDVLNFSISGDPETLEDPVDLAFKNAAAAGVFSAASAGNSAGDGVPVAHLGPWQTTVAAAAHREEDGPVPSVGSFSGRGPISVDAEDQTILKPDIGAPGINVLAAYASDADGPNWGYLTGTSMSSPHIAGLGALLAAEYPDWSPMAIKSAMQTSAADYANAESNQAFVGGTGFVEPRDFLNPGLVFDSTEADWDAFLADPSTGYDLNAAYVHIPQLGTEPTTVTRTVTNPGSADATFEASFAGPDTLSVTVEPASATVPAGGTAEVTITVANTGAPTDEWQEGDLSWTSGDTVVEIPVLARGQVAGEDPGPEPDPMVERVFGSDRYDTAAEISALYPDIETVYVASGTGFADAMSGSPAASQGLVPRMMTTPDGDPAPVLLTKNDRLPNTTAAALGELDPSNIVILGGDGAVNGDVEAELASYGEVTRVEGTDRYETSANLAMMFGGDVDTVYLASGADAAYADALTGAARAGSETAPVLLTRPDMVPAATAEALATLNPDNVIVLGGEGAVSDAVYTAVQADDRIAGANRYETAVAISQEHEPDVEIVHIASGRDFPDALAGSALAGTQDVPVLLTKPDQLPSATLAELERLSPERVVILGGTKAVSQDVEDRLNEEYPGWVG